jgi:tetratricopeptide (TPR) repeat protein
MRNFLLLIFFLLVSNSAKSVGQYDAIFAMPADSQLREISFYQNFYLWNMPAKQTMDSLQMMIDEAEKSGNANLALEIGLMYHIHKHRLAPNDSMYLRAEINKLVNKANSKKLYKAELYLRAFLAMEYCNYKKYEQGIAQYLKAKDIEEKLPMHNTFEAQELYYNLGLFYYSYKDYKNCIATVQKATSTMQHSSRRHCDEFNTIALCFAKLNNIDSAIANYNSALMLAKKYNEKINEFIIQGNIGALYLQQKQYAKALPLIKIDADSNGKYEVFGCSASAIGRLLEIGCKTNNVALAQEYEPKALAVLPKLWIDDYNVRATLYDGLTSYYTKINNGAKAQQYRDSSTANADRQKIQYDADKIKEVVIQTEVNKYTQQLQVSEQSLKRGSAIRNIVIVCLLLIAIISFLLIRNQKIQSVLDAELAKQQQVQLQSEKNEIEVEKNVIASEKKIVEESLKLAKEKLQLFTINLTNKNVEIEKLQQNLEAIKALPIAKEQKETQIADIEKLLNATILTDADWQNFKQLFEGVYAGFFGKLKLNYPTLTAGETRMLALSKLNLSAKEIGGMLGISADSVKKSKQRISNKLNWEEDVSFQDFVNGI